MINLLCSQIDTQTCILWCIVAICATIIICYGVVSIIKAITRKRVSRIKNTQLIRLFISF